MKWSSEDQFNKVDLVFKRQDLFSELFFEWSPGRSIMADSILGNRPKLPKYARDWCYYQFYYIPRVYLYGKRNRIQVCFDSPEDREKFKERWL